MKGAGEGTAKRSRRPGMRRVGGLGACLLALVVANPAGAEALACACQAVIACGADSCDLAEGEFCASTDIAISLAVPSIRLCAFSYCLEGPATLQAIDEDRAVLSGSYRPSTGPARDETAVFVLHDATTGIGVIQTTDEEAVARYTVICRAPD